MNATVTVTRKQGSTMGTVIAAVRDDQGEVGAVDFYVTVLDAAATRLGPYPADIVRRPAPGVYEKDVLLDTLYQTKVETVLQAAEGSATVAGTPQLFGVRELAAAGGTTLLLQDQDTAAAPAAKLVFQGQVLQIDSAGVATLDLDGRYAPAAHTHAYLPLAGGSLEGVLSFGAATRQMLNLWSTGYAIGVQTSTQYFRTGAGFAWYLGGAHDDAQWSPGGGTTLMTLSNAGALAVTSRVSASSVKATGSRFLGPDDAFLHLSNTAAQFLTSGNAALHGRFGSLLLSDAYSDAGSVPAFGLYAKGGARLGPFIDVGVGAYNAAIRRTDGGHLHLQAGVTGSVVIGDPASVTHKLNVQGDVHVQGGWLRTGGNGGWFSETHGGGIFMDEPSTVKVFNGKSFYVPGSIRTGGSLYAAGASTRLSSDDWWWYATSTKGMQIHGHDGACKGYLYHDTTGFGLLHAGGGWAVRTWQGGVQTYGSLGVDIAPETAYRVNVNGGVNAQGGAYHVNRNSWYGDNALLFGHGGGWYMQDATWVRTQNQKSVWAGGNFSTDGGLTLGRNGYLDAGLRIDSQGRIRACSQAQAAGFQGAALELREYDFTGNSGDYGWHNAPRIGFHWGGVRASQIGMAPDGRIHILDNPGNANEDLQARDFYNNRGHRMAASVSGTGNPTMAANEGTLYIQY